MKSLFYLALSILLIVELLSVYLIMPMPGSQSMDSLDFAYFIHHYRWVLRLVIAIVILWSGYHLVQRGKWRLPVTLLMTVIILIVLFKWQMSADEMFLQPETLTFSGRQDAVLPDSSIVLSVNINGKARAYPIRYIQYHHQVRDTINNQPVMITYCNVCRSGRVFDPVLDNRNETFRLVGMNRYNAMFEDSETGSWWRQANGEAVAGPMKGTFLEEIPSLQHSLASFFDQYPSGEVMLPDPAFIAKYDSLGAFERGVTTSELTGTNRDSWQDKSWVIGIVRQDDSFAYDWNKLVADGYIHDQEEGVLIVVWDEGSSFAAYDIRNVPGLVSMSGDSIQITDNTYDLYGTPAAGDSKDLIPLQAYQEFWHSWRTFHPDTQRRN